MFITRALGESYQKLTFAYNLVGYYQGLCAIGRASVSLRSLKAAWFHRMDDVAAILWSNSLKFSTDKNSTIFFPKCFRL